VYVCVCVYICIYVYIHTHTHTHIYIYICIHTHLFFFFFFPPGEEDSKTSAKEDLKSYEEIASTTPNTHQVPHSLELLTTSDMLKKGRVQLVCNVC